MKRGARFSRISISLVFLVIFPWFVVLLSTVQLALIKVPNIMPQDANEIRALERALLVYKAQYGEYPPDFTSPPRD